MKKKTFFYAGLVPVIVFFFFFPSLFNGFVNWDDPYVFWGNPLVKNFSWHGIQTIFVTMWSGQYHRFIPLSMVFFAAEYHFFGIHPLGYHLVSVLLHALNSLGVFILVYLLTAMEDVAIATALLFGMHPLQVQIVAQASGGHYLISTFLFLSTVILYIQGLRWPLQRAGFELLVFLTFVLALLFYSQLVLALPLILLALDYYFKGKISRDDLLGKLPHFLMSFYFGWLTLKAAHHISPDFVPTFLTHHLPLFQRLNLSSEALWMYVQKFFIPCSLSCLYPMVYYSHGPLIIYSLMGAAVFLFLAALRQRDGLGISFLGLLWFLLTIAPFLHIYGVSESIIYDRYFYLPSIGIFLMIVGVVSRTLKNFYLKGAVILWFIFVIALSYQRIEVWQDSETLWTDFISQYPGFPDGYLNRSDYYLRTHKPQAALRDLDILLKIDPQSAFAYQNLGHAFYQLRQWRKEVEAYTKVLNINPNNVSVYVDRGTAYFMLGEDNLALEDFNRALQIDPGEANALLNRRLLEKYSISN